MKIASALCLSLVLAPVLALAARSGQAIEVPSDLKDAVGPDGQEIGADTAEQRKLARDARDAVMTPAHAEFSITSNVVEIVDRGPSERGSMDVVVKNEEDRKIAGGLLEAVIPELPRAVPEGHPRFPNVYTADEYFAKVNASARLRAETMAEFAKGNFAVVHRHVRTGDPETPIVLKPDLALNALP